MPGKTFGPSNAIDWAAYTEECERTNAQDQDRILHGAIGMMTEAGEILDIFKKHIFYGKPVDVAHLKEEIGDFFWYLAIWHHGHSLAQHTESMLTRFSNRDNTIYLSTRPPTKFKNEESYRYSLAYRLVRATSRVFERDARSMMISEHAVDLPVAYSEEPLLDSLIYLMKAFNLEPSEVLEANSAKLRARYPEEGWNKERAENRNLAAERKVLENGSP